jgi:endonuclease/exonuclease/phosphatase family metal-dependent hydrolase
MKRLLRSGLMFFNIVLFALSILTLLAFYIPSNKIWILPFFGFLLPFILPANLIFFLIWVQRRRFIKSLLSLSILVSAIPQISTGFAFNFGSEAAIGSTDTFKFMSYNVRLFDLYNWSKNIETRNKIFDFLKDESPDIIAFQEYFYSSKPNYFITRDSLVKMLQMPYYVEGFDVIKGHGHYGVAIFSKFPIISSKVVDFPDADGNNGLYVDIKVKQDTVRVFSGHLSSISLHGPDYKAVRKILEQPEREDFETGKRLVQKFKEANTRRVAHARIVRQVQEESPFPVILALDLNDTPFSNVYKEVRGNLNDAFLSSGFGFGQTYIGEMPSYRIDYIFYSGNRLKPHNFNTHSVVLSDHKPLSVNFSVK